MESFENFGIQSAVKTIKELCPGVEFIVLYGSIAEGRNNKLSDIDIAVYPVGDKKERFESRIKMLGRLSDRFDIQIFQDLPLYIKMEIIRKGNILYYRDYGTLFGIYLQTIKEYEDFEKHLNTYYSYIGAGILEETG